MNDHAWTPAEIAEYAAKRFSSAADLIDAFLEDVPEGTEPTAREVRDHFIESAWKMGEYAKPKPSGVCKTCGKAIVQYLGQWVHCYDDGQPMRTMGRSCRSASYERLGEWDESLPRKVYATPVKGEVK